MGISFRFLVLILQSFSRYIENGLKSCLRPKKVIGVGIDATKRSKELDPR